MFDWLPHGDLFSALQDFCDGPDKKRKEERKKERKSKRKRVREAKNRDCVCMREI